jgi:hypothetical protein
MYSDLKLIFVLTSLLLVIILLSGIKVCGTPYGNRFIDRKYNYISEPFDILDDIKNINSQYIASNIDKMTSIKLNNLKIEDLNKKIASIELELKRKNAYAQ